MTTEPHMPNLHAMALQHFNEPMISFGKLVRCIGYGETAVDCYIIVKDRLDKETWNTCVGGYTFLNALKGQNHVKAHNGHRASALCASTLRQVGALASIVSRTMTLLTEGLL